ncbi:hypothetical protein [Neorhizobium sp. LjRoot104]|uniref:hypothetical protein n=1 Tax=Neorhizobium sp. LjRoot104 TaxID=3342254 RepID=UPI003ED0FA3C
MNVCLAQEAVPVAGSLQSSSTLERILGFNERSKTFSSKRNERSQIIRSIEILKSEVAENNNRIAKIDEEQAKSQVISARSQTSDDVVLDLNEKIRKAQYDLENTQVEMERYKSQLEAELNALVKNAETSLLSADDLTQKRKLEVRIQYLPQEAEMQIKKAQFELKNLEARKQEFSEYQKKEKEYYDKLISDDIKQRQSLSEERNTLVQKGINFKDNIRKLEDRQDVLNNEINDLIDIGDAESSFRLSISTMFAFLVFVVIIGFFLIIRKKDNVVFEIFSKDSGIQFITLFSIVIAIILFGITGVLEGKELAALLAGLSGYILGRGANVPTAPNGGAQPAPASIPAPTPAPAP